MKRNPFGSLRTDSLPDKVLPAAELRSKRQSELSEETGRHRERKENREKGDERMRFDFEADLTHRQFVVTQRQNPQLFQGDKRLGRSLINLVAVNEQPLQTVQSGKLMSR
jgi:hypothetical protein